MTRFLVLECSAEYITERAYVYDVVLREFLGIDYRVEIREQTRVRLTLDGDLDGRALLIADVLFQTPGVHWLRDESLPKRPVQRCAVPAEFRGNNLIAARIPVLYSSSSSDLLEATPDGYALHLDIFGSIFYMLTRYEEAVRPERDAHERFPASASLLAQERLLETPLVDEYVELLWLMLARLWPSLKRDRRLYRLMLSHDVDEPWCASGRSFPRLARSGIADIVRRRDVGLAARRVAASIAARRGKHDSDPCNTFEFIMDMSEHNGLRSAFYFMTDYSGSGFDGRYDFADPWIEALLVHIGRRGHEIGLHTSYNTFQDEQQTRYEFDRLRATSERLGVRQDAWGGRQHYLRWDNPTTWQNLDMAGLSYDSTLTFAERAGFRCGTCYEYPVFNLKTRRRLSLRERPLIVMEASLLGYQGTSLETTLQKTLELNLVCRRYGGNFTLLWHNGNLMSNKEKNLYARLLAELNE